MNFKIWMENEGEVISADELAGEVRRLHYREEDLWEGDLLDRLYNYPKYRKELLPISALETEWDVDYDKVDHYVDLLTTSPNYPPIIFDPRAKSIIDGTHRLEALKKAGHTHVWTWVGVRA